MNKTNFNYFFIVLLIILANLITMALSGNSPIYPNIYNSYALQAESWLNGRLDLSVNYSHLEIAVYNGKYFVSFPPFPSMLLLPFVFFLGTNTPDHFIVLFMAVLSGIYAYKLALNITADRNKALFYSLFLCIGSNFLFLSNTGYVWFMAQVFAFSFTLMSLYYARIKKPSLSMFLFCCALGCRPLNMVYMPYLIYMIYNNEYTFKTFAKKLITWAIPAIILGCAYMMLNYLRFGSVFEFGHNYLPEFISSEHGQFSLAYLTDNFTSLWRLPSFENGRLLFHAFDGTAFWLVSPIFVTYAATFIRHSVCYKKLDTAAFFPAVLIISHLLLLCTHKTMGGWHFGHRYTVDVLPVLFLGLLIQDAGFGKSALLFSVPLLAWGLVLNTIGTAYLYLGYL